MPAICKESPATLPLTRRALLKHGSRLGVGLSALWVGIGTCGCGGGGNGSRRSSAVYRQYAVTEISGLGYPANETMATALSNRGEVTGRVGSGHWYAPNSYFHAFRWRDGEMIDLGVPESLPNVVPGESRISWGNSINDRGDVLGDGKTGNNYETERLSPFFWRNDLPVALNPAFDPESLNNRGELLGRQYDANHYHIGWTLWRNGEYIPVEVPGYSKPGYETPLNLHSLSDDGTVLGFVQEYIEASNDYNTRWFIWSESGVEFIHIPPYVSVRKRDSRGQILGSSSTRQLLLWEDGNVHNLAVAPGELDSLKTATMNTRSEVIATVGRAPSGRAHVWANDDVFDLNDAVTLERGWTLTEASDINDTGQILCQGQRNEDRRSFLLTPL